MDKYPEVNAYSCLEVALSVGLERMTPSNLHLEDIIHDGDAQRRFAMPSGQLNRANMALPVRCAP